MQSFDTCHGQFVGNAQSFQLVDSQDSLEAHSTTVDPRETFGKVSPLLSSGEWEMYDFLAPYQKKQSIFGRIIRMFYS
ncbi:MAG: hypothetical protein KDD60_10335 [Bdellovibrionales bacterium]|nr:hypothetical protein [Bdellovibrionales bacterium]